MNMENIAQALGMMGQGMLGIFVVLGIIALLVAVMQKIDNRKK
ncbi:OadG-related small transporter subunit [Flavonifractor sp. An100]|nr:OadG-related small transporter subunit [Flavonifractor sp. An100]